MGRVYVTGDVHHTIDIDKVVAFSVDEGKGLNKSDVLIVAGDFGLLWDAQQTAREKVLVDWYNELPFSVAFVDGNHENHDRLDQLPTAEKWGSDIGVVSPFISHLRRGRIYEINEKKIWTFGGGFSIDKASRQEYISWWRQELPSMTEMNQGYRNVVGKDIDYIITHTCPIDVFNKIALHFNLSHKDAWEERQLQNFFQEMAKLKEFKGWFFGHFHVDFEAEMFDKKFMALYNRIVELTK